MHRVMAQGHQGHPGTTTESHTLEPTLDVSSALTATAAAAIAAVAVQYTTGLAERWTPGAVPVYTVRSDHGKRERADN